MASITKPGLSLIANPNTYQQGPSRLTSVFPVVQSDLHSIVSGITYETDFCSEDGYTNIDFNDFDDCIRTADKTFTEGLLFTDSITTTDPLTLYAALKCRPGAIGGGQEADYVTRATRRLAHLESHYLEDVLMSWVQDNGTDIGLSGGDALQDVGALANLADQTPNPVMLMGFSTAVTLGTHLGNLESLGIKVVASPHWGSNIALVGAVNIWGTQVQVNTAPDAVSTNYIMAIAERQYIMAVECGTAYFTSVDES
jgi:hypothetical protein